MSGAAVTVHAASGQVTVQDAQLAAMWSDFLDSYCRDQVVAAALDYPETRSLTVAFNDIQLRSPDLADHLLARPSHCLRVGNAMLHQVDVPADPKPRLHLRVNGLPNAAEVQVRDLRAEHLGRLVAVEGRITKVTEVKFKVLEAAFECKICGNLVHVLQEDEHVMEPVQCDGCEKTGPWKMLEGDCRYIDHQLLRIEEIHEHLGGGLQPERLIIHVRDDLVQSVRPGDRVRLNGILATQARLSGRLKRTEFNKVLEAVSIERQEASYEEVQVTEEDEAAIRELAKAPGVHDELVKRLAPSVHGLEEVKLGLLLSIAGGVARWTAGQRQRGDIHVLMVGDPGVAKSQLLKRSTQMAPRSIFTSGRGTTAAGLTVAAVKDSDLGEGRWSLEAGALVLADGGLAGIDELDKMTKEDQSSLHQAMEQQEVSKSAAGVSATMPCRCPIQAAANPKLGRFDEYEPIGNQVNMPPALLSRFDLIFALRDRPNRDRDAALSQHLYELRTGSSSPDPAAGGDREAVRFFRSFIAYAKRVEPRLTDKAHAYLQEQYVELRSSDQDGAIPITARHLEAMMRLTEASARIRLSGRAGLEDAKRAWGLMLHSLRSVGIDAETGRLDIDRIATGVSHSQQARVRKVQDIVCELAAAAPGGFAREEDIIEEAQRQDIMPEATRKALETLRRNNSVYQKAGGGTYAPLDRT